MYPIYGVGKGLNLEKKLLLIQISQCIDFPQTLLVYNVEKVIYRQFCCKGN